MKIIIGTDHRGFDLKEEILASEALKDDGVEWVDVGAAGYMPDDDYTTYAKSATGALMNHDGEMAVLLCGSGAGICIAANKVNGIRCSIGINTAQVTAARRDDNINVLAIAAEYTDPSEVIEMIRVFVDTPFSNEPRYQHRIDQISAIEHNQDA